MLHSKINQLKMKDKCPHPSLSRWARVKKRRRECGILESYLGELANRFLRNLPDKSKITYVRRLCADFRLALLRDAI